MDKLKLSAVEIKRLTGRKTPLNLLDKVDELTNHSLNGLVNITMNDSFFQGHFPENPVMPGVLIIETMEQACEVMFKNQSLNLKLTQIKRARFREMVRPGDQLTIKIKKMDDEFKYQCEAYLKEKLACSAELFFTSVN